VTPAADAGLVLGLEGAGEGLRDESVRRLGGGATNLAKTIGACQRKDLTTGHVLCYYKSALDRPLRQGDKSMLGPKLRELHLAKRLSQRQLAAQVGVSNTVHRGDRTMPATLVFVVSLPAPRSATTTYRRSPSPPAVPTARIPRFCGGQPDVVCRWHAENADRAPVTWTISLRREAGYTPGEERRREPDNEWKTMICELSITAARRTISYSANIDAARTEPTTRRDARRCSRSSRISYARRTTSRQRR
jgi:hypothetical protein